MIGRRFPVTMFSTTSACPYDQRFWVEAPHPFITRDRLREALARRSGETVLEVGPGTGYYSLPMARLLAPGSVLHVLDVQQQMLDHTMRRAHEEGITNIVPRQGDARALPHSDATFDAAYLVTVLGEVSGTLSIDELCRSRPPSPASQS